MPHASGDVALHGKRLDRDCEQYVASREFEARGARCRYRLHSGRARNRALICLRDSSLRARQAFHLKRMISSTLRFLFSAALFSVCFNTFAVTPPPKEGGQTPSPRGSPTASPKSAPPGAIDEKLFSGMQWRQIGPFRGGRALAIEGVPGEPDTYYFGAVAGGVWKTTDGGQ